MNPDRQLVLIEHVGYPTEQVKQLLYEMRLPYFGLGFYFPRARELKEKIGVPGGGRQFPFFVVTEDGEPLKASEIVIIRNGSDNDPARKVIQEMILILESTHDPREPKPAPAVAPMLSPYVHEEALGAD